MPVDHRLYIKDGTTHHHSLGSEPLLQHFSCDNIVGFLFVCLLFWGDGVAMFHQKAKVPSYQLMLSSKTWVLEVADS